MAVMEQSNFEKNIQQKLDELKIPPSDAVWISVEKRIGKKQKDRKVIFIFFFLILFLLSGGYWLLKSSKNGQQQNQLVSNIGKKDSNLSAIIKNDSSLKTSPISSGIYLQKADVVNVTAEKSKASPTVRSEITKDKNDIGRINQNRKKLSRDEIDFKSKEKILPDESSSIERLNTVENEIENADLNNKNFQNKISPDSLSNQLEPEKIKKEMVFKKDSSAKKHPENRQKNHWMLGITFSGGKSMMVHDPLGINNNNSSDYLQNSPNPGSGSGGNPYFTPSEMKNSFAFIGGAFIEKNISAKSKMSVGISYKYFSSTNKVGSQSSTRLNQYSAANTVNFYRNHFHFLELPVSFKFQLNNPKSLPLYWEAGISISQLISSNALQFQSSPGLYFNDNSMFNKTQLGLSTGISATLFAKQKIPVTIGPYFYYGASKLAGKGLYQNKHFSFIGLRTEILFQKK
jgi:hypothetical protein